MRFLRKVIAADFKALTDSFSNGLESKYGAVVELNLTHEDQLALNSIVIPKAKRGKGIGSKIMQEIAEYADKHKKIVVLDPSTDFGASSVARLKKFYSRFGFVKNSGSKKNFIFRQAMIRNPK